MMRQSRQAVLPEISGNKTSSLRKSICSDLLTLFNSPHSALPSLLVSGMPEWQVHNQSDKHLQSWYCRQLRSALLFHEPRIAALQVNLKEAYSHTLAISLEIMLYHDETRNQRARGEPVDFRKREGLDFFERILSKPCAEVNRRNRCKPCSSNAAGHHDGSCP